MLDAPLEVGLSRSVKAFEKDRESKIFSIWLSDRPNLKDEYKYDFESYRDRLDLKRINKKELEVKKKRIDSEVERIKHKFAHKGVIK